MRALSGCAMFGALVSFSAAQNAPQYYFSTFAGRAGLSGNLDATGVNARFNRPWGITVDAARNVYVADAANFTIRKITPDGVVTTIAGQGGSLGIVDGQGSTARFGSISSSSIAITPAVAGPFGLARGTRWPGLGGGFVFSYDPPYEYGWAGYNPRGKSNEQQLR